MTTELIQILAAHMALASLLPSVLPILAVPESEPWELWAGMVPAGRATSPA